MLVQEWVDLYHLLEAFQKTRSHVLKTRGKTDSF